MRYRLEEDSTPKKIPAAHRQGGDLLEEWRSELDGYFEQMVEFNVLVPDDIFRTLSGFSARASFMRSQVARSHSKVWQGFKTQELDYFLSECDRQFKYWSRILSNATLDWDMQKG